MKNLIKYIIIACLVSCVPPAVIFYLIKVEKISGNSTQLMMLCCIPIIVIACIFIGIIFNRRKWILIFIPITSILYIFTMLYADGTIKQYINNYKEYKSDYEDYTKAFRMFIDTDYRDYSKSELPDKVNIINYNNAYITAMRSNKKTAFKYITIDDKDSAGLLKYINIVRLNKFYYDGINTADYVDITSAEIDIWTEEKSLVMNGDYIKIKFCIYLIMVVFLIFIVAMIFASIFNNYFKEIEKKEEDDYERSNKDLDWMK